MKIHYPFFVLIVSLSLLTGLQPLKGQSVAAQKQGTGNVTPGGKIQWTSNPFDHQVFIENKGQFEGPENGAAILYGAKVGDLYVFITTNGLVYKYTEYPEVRESPSKKTFAVRDPDDVNWKKKPKQDYVTATWEGSTGNVTTVAGEEQTYYYTYPSADNKGTIKASIFKTILCRNVYPGIDIKYMFPEGKDGFKYIVIVHPGADLSAVKLKYDGVKKMNIDKDGNIEISSGWGRFTDHAPISSYEGENTPLASGYQLQDKVESFKVDNANITKTLIIDPWSINWTSVYAGNAGYTGAYDLDYDYAGNVYVYGGYNPFQLAKYNSAGVQQWTYNTSNFPNIYYGAFCVDKASGVSFCFEGFGGGSWAYTDKISTTGALLSFLTSGTLDEQWRATYDLCSHTIAIAGGGTNASLQAATLDTNNNLYTSVNIMNLPPAQPYHDLCLIASDPIVDTTYMASARSTGNPGLGNNILMRLPMPSLTPTGLSTYDKFNFQEVGSVSYAATGVGNTNGMNGMAISPNWLYMYNGDSLQQVDKNTGTIINKVNVSGSHYAWGGLTVDLCDDIYLGNSTSVDLYNSSLSLTGNIGPFVGTVYDVVLGNGVLSSADSVLYVCGKGFVSSVKIDPPNPPKIIKSKTFVCSCNCTATGILTFCGSPDTSSNVSYLWSNGQTTHTATGLCPGNTYTLTVSLGCAQVFRDTFSMPLTDTFHMAETEISPTCGLCNGSATVTASGGGKPYTYLWTPSGQTTQTATGLCAGTYTIKVIDSCGDVTTAAIVLTSVGLTLTSNVTANEKCNGNCVGIATVNVSGGVSPYVYSWAPSGGNKATAAGLCAGTYTITVKDVNGCSGTVAAIITQPTPIALTQAVVNVTCNGGKGSATVTASGGNSPYTYLWNPTGQTKANATGLGAGNYTVTITDSSGCTTTIRVTVTQPALLTASIGNITYPPCNGGVGSATATGGGGVSPYTYSWNPTLQNTATATGLSARTYTVTITDTNGCTATSSVVITQPTAVAGSIVVVNPLCNGNTGTATVTASGGTPGYKYLWTNGETLAAATGMLAGNYTVTITDSHGCTGTVSTTITQPTALNVTTSFTHASCGLPNGTATASPTGGTTPYVYLWSPGGQTSITAINLLAGTYTVKVTDNHNCTASASVTITQPTAVTAAISNIVNVTCFGLNNGSATVVGGGGTAPYGYQWSPAGGTGATGTGLAAGKYVVTVKDVNGCTATATATLTQPAVLAVTESGPPIHCLGGSATYTATVTGGTGPYGYAWNPGNQTGSSASLLPPSNITYTVGITDANGCTASGYVTFTFPPPLAVSISGASVTCSKRSANLCALATGGTGGDTYLWEPINLSSPCITVPAAFTTIYTVTVTDDCHVSATAVTTVNVLPPPAVYFISNSTEGCAPVCIQFRNLTPASGGQELYEWSFGNGDSIKQNPLYCYTKSGNYNVTLTVVSDSGCSSTLTKQNMVTVYSAPKAAFTYSPKPATILTPTIQFTDESTDAYGLGYRWWSFGDASDSVSNLADPTHTYGDTGTYCATLIEMNNKGCMDTVTNCLIIGPQYNLYIPSAFTPNSDGLNETFQPKGEYIRNFEMYIFDRWGMQLYHTTDITKGWNGTVSGGSTISQEDVYVYKISITDAEGIQHNYIGNVTLLK